jgi:hypothetical protein
MYAVGCINIGPMTYTDEFGAQSLGWGSFRGGIYLYPGRATGGWGGDHAGAIGEREHYGQHKGRWYVSLPYGVLPVQQPASVRSYGGRLYLNGGYSYNLVIDEHHRCWKQGIRPPEEVPDIVYTPVGGSNITTIAYFSWYDEFTGERSPLSKGIELADCPFSTSKLWQNLPQRPPDDVYIGDDQVESYDTADNQIAPRPSLTGGSRIIGLRPGDKVHLLGSATQRYSQCWYYNPLMFDVHQDWVHGASSGIAVATVTRATHLELWLSVAGDLPRLRTRLAIGSTSYTEASAVEDLGEAFIDGFQRFPRCELNEIYHDRQIMAGDPENPDTVFLSELFYPERFVGLTFQTRNGEPITGMLSTKDYVLVFTRNNTYMLQGYTDSDYTFTVIDQSLGSVGHNCNVVIFGNPYVWTEQGPYMFNGQWHPLSPENRWVPVSPAVYGADAYTSGLLQAGRSMFATIDPYFNTYMCSESHIAAREQEQPWKYRSQGRTALPQEEQIEGSVELSAFPWSEMEKANRFYAILDYTRVQPEAGGRYSTGRLMWDTKVRYNNATELARPEWKHYLRNRWGQGALYQVGGLGGSFTIMGMRITDYTAYAWNLEASNFMKQYRIEQDSYLSLGFDMIGEEGGYEMEQKSFKRLWFHMRRNINYVQGTGFIVYAMPDSGFYNHRMLDTWLFEGTPGLDGVYYKGSGYYSPMNPNNKFPVGKPEGDVIMMPKPQHLAGRGLWVTVVGRYFQWHGFGGEYIIGREGRLQEEESIGP